MDLSVLIIVSCVLTTISMFFIVGFLIYLVRYGGQGVKGIVDRIMGGGDDEAKKATPERPQRQAAAKASSQSLRERARSLDFPAPSGANAQSAGQFGAQVAGAQAINDNFGNPAPQNNQFAQGQQASLRPRGGGQRGQYPEFNPQATGGGQGFQMSTPSLSPSRPFQGGSEIPRPQQGQQFNQQPNQLGQRPQQGQQFNQQPNQLGQRPQQGQQFNQQPNQLGQRPQQGQQFNQQPNQLGQRPQQGQQFNQQPNQLGQRPQQGQQFNQQPNQLGQRPQQEQQFNQQPNQLGQRPQQGQQFNQQSAQPQQPPPLGGLGNQNRPPLRSKPNFDGGGDNRALGGRDKRQSDDYDRIYDDRGGRGDNFVDQAADFIDNF